MKTETAFSSAHPLCERGATETEVYDNANHAVRPCEVCATNCPLAGKDHLVICKHFKEVCS